MSAERIRARVTDLANSVGAHQRDIGHQADEFAEALTELCRRYGFGIANDPAVFVMEPIDRSLRYIVDSESRLVLR